MMNYFFYKDYMFNKMIKHSDPLLVSAIMISVIEFFNALEVFVILNTYLLHLELTMPIIMTCIIVIGIILIILNVHYFRKNEEQICNKYKGERLLKNILGYVIYVVYLIGSFALIFVMKEIFGYHL